MDDRPTEKILYEYDHRERITAYVAEVGASVIQDLLPQIVQKH